MKRFFAVIALFALLAFSGCSAGETQNNNSSAGQSEIVTSGQTPASVEPTEENTETPEVTATVPPKPTLVAFGYVKHADNGSLTIVICERIYHLADELDRNGDPYGHDWTEINFTDQTLTLTPADSAKYMYADLFADGTQSDDKIKLKSVSLDTFMSVCTKSYYGSKLFFEFTYKSDSLLSAELFLTYYLNG